MSDIQSWGEINLTLWVVKYKYHSKILNNNFLEITTPEGNIMNPLDSITGTIVTGFVLAIIIMLVL